MGTPTINCAVTACMVFAIGDTGSKYAGHHLTFAAADGDGDGVPNSSDACPTVAAMTANGCPATLTPGIVVAAPARGGSQEVQEEALPQEAQEVQEEGEPASRLASGPLRDTARAMPEENVEIIRRAIDAFNRLGVNGVVDLAHPDGTAYPFPEWIGAAVYRGREGWKALLSEWTDNFDDFRWESEQLIDAGDKVVTLMRIKGQIKGSAVPLSQPVGAVFADFRDDGTVAEAHFFLTHREALEAAGLSE